MIYLAIFIYLQVGFGFTVAVAVNWAEEGVGPMPWWCWPLWPLLTLTWPFFAAAIITESMHD